MIANPNDGNSPRVEAATPIIDVSAEGLITATTEQEAGYVPGGSKSATQQLTTQGAKTVTPGTTAQTAVVSGRYTTGDVDVAGDANLKAENIAEGVSIFGVTGTHSGGGTEIQTTSTVSIQNGKFGMYSTTVSMQGKQNIVCCTYALFQYIGAAYITGGISFSDNEGEVGIEVSVSGDIATISGSCSGGGITIEIIYAVF